MRRYSHDTYLSNVVPAGTAERVRKALEDVSRDQRQHGFHFPRPSEFQTIGELRSSLRSTAIRSYFVASASTRVRQAGRDIEYRFADGWTPVVKSEAHEFFLQTNLALAETDLAGRPPGEYWYAVISGHFPDALVEPLGRHRRRFEGVKVGSARPLPLSDARYHPLWTWCADAGLPVLLHCSGASDRDFLDGVQICRDYPSLSVILSHLGGMEQRGSDVRVRNEATLRARVATLRKNGLPDNLSLNNAVYDVELADDFIDAAPELQPRILNALDLPFFGTLDESIARLSQCRSAEASARNTERYFGSLERTATGT